MIANSLSPLNGSLIMKQQLLYRIEYDHISQFTINKVAFHFFSRRSLQGIEVGRDAVVWIHLFADVFDQPSFVIQAGTLREMQVSRDDVQPGQLRGLIVSLLFELFLDQLVDTDDLLSLGDSDGGEPCGIGLNSATFFIFPQKTFLFPVLQRLLIVGAGGRKAFVAHRKSAFLPFEWLGMVHDFLIALRGKLSVLHEMEGAFIHLLNGRENPFILEVAKHACFLLDRRLTMPLDGQSIDMEQLKIQAFL